ncbi:hypothetical protein Tco_0508719 [Tanacetum coccineum]
MLFGIGIPPEDVRNVARAISCSHDSLPFTYLGLPAGRNLKKVEAWRSLPLYELSIFKASKSVISHLETIRRRFFWGFKENEHKMVHVGVEPETLQIQAPVEALPVLMSVTKDDDATSLPVAGEVIECE